MGNTAGNSSRQGQSAGRVEEDIKQDKLITDYIRL